MKIIFIILFLILFVVRPPVEAYDVEHFLGRQATYQDIQRFQEYNPDGYKYQFVKDYLLGLGYWWQNVRRKQGVISLFLEELENTQRIQEEINQLTMDNMNLRIARNYVEKYRHPDNGLMLKVVDLFQATCNEQIQLNQEEKQSWQKLREALSGKKDQTLRAQEVEHQEMIAQRRKDSMLHLLEASMLLNKVLISSDPDALGQFSRLGISAEERQKLLYKIDEFYEEGFQGGVRPGQSVLQGSISVIREVLEDPQWDVLDS